MLSLQLLGTPQVLYENKHLKFRSRKVMALLIYLVMEQGLHSREKLCFLLWANSDAERSKASLRNTLSRLKKALPSTADFIITRQNSIGFNHTQTFNFDIALIHRALLPEASERDLDSALAVKRGSFLDGFSIIDAPEYEQWVQQKSVFIEQGIAEIYNNLSQKQLAQGDNHQAIVRLREWVAAFPLSELAYQRLMQAYALVGDRASAISTYEQCKQIVGQELGIAPSSETEVLMSHIEQSTPSPINSKIPTKVSQRLVIPFVGRKDAQAQISKQFSIALSGQLQVCAIIGTAGMGKTHLVETSLLRMRLNQPSLDILRGRAFEFGGDLPYQPLVDALRVRLDAENAPDDLLEDVWLAELSRLLPELRERYPDLPMALGGNAKFIRSRLFESVAQLGIALASRQPLTVFLDDIQWADIGTLDILHYLIRRWRNEQISAFIFLTIRQEGLLKDHSLRRWIGHLQAERFLTEVVLHPLSIDELSELGFSLSRDDTDASQIAEWLQRETDASPFFVTETLQMVARENRELSQKNELNLLALSAAIKNRRSLNETTIPANVRNVVLSRINQLSVAAQTLLSVASTIGRNCNFERLCEVANVNIYDSLPTLEEILNTGLLREVQNADESLAFAHDKIRDIVYREISTTRQHIYHRKIVEILETDNATAAEIAFHAAAGNLPEQAFQYAIIAGNDALNLNAFADALKHFNQALDYIDELTISSDDYCSLYLQRGRTLELCGDYQAALDNYHALYDIATQSNNQTMQLSVLLAEATIRSTANELSDFSLGESLCEHALILIRELNDSVAEARIKWNLLNVYRMTGRNQLALEIGQQALKLAEQVQDDEITAYIANDLSMIYMVEGDVTQCVSLAEYAVTLWRKLGNVPMLTDSLTISANMKVMRGEYRVALSMATETQDICRQMGNDWALSYSLFTSSMVYWQRMEIDAAFDAMQTSVQLAKSVGFTGSQALVSVFQSMFLSTIGDKINARALADYALDVADKHIPLFLHAAKGALALVDVNDGKLEDAKQFVSELINESYTPNLMDFFSPEIATYAYLCAIQDYDSLIDFSDTVLIFLNEHDLKMYITPTLFYRAKALVALGKMDKSITVLNDALSTLKLTDGRWYYPEMIDLLIDMYRQRGKHNEVERLLIDGRMQIHEILKTTTNDNLKAYFLQQPSVKHILSE